MAGPYRRKTWYADDERAVDFYDMKGVVEVLLDGIGLPSIDFESKGGFAGYDPRVGCGISSCGSAIGQMGRVASHTMDAFDLGKQDIYIFELDIDAVLKNLSRERQFQPFAKFPAVYRDISIIIDRQVQSGDITGIIMQEGGDLVESVQIFDVYEGEKIGPSEKAIAFRICYRSKKQTLDGAEVNRLHGSIVDTIRQRTGGRQKEG